MPKAKPTVVSKRRKKDERAHAWSDKGSSGGVLLKRTQPFTCADCGHHRAHRQGRRAWCAMCFKRTPNGTFRRDWSAPERKVPLPEVRSGDRLVFKRQAGKLRRLGREPARLTTEVIFAVLRERFGDAADQVLQVRTLQIGHVVQGEVAARALITSNIEHEFRGKRDTAERREQLCTIVAVAFHQELMWYHDPGWFKFNGAVGSTPVSVKSTTRAGNLVARADVAVSVRRVGA